MRYSNQSKRLYHVLYALLFIFATLAQNTSHATTYYVAISGNNSNSGTEISPFRTIKYGISSLSAGDTLYVKAGNYKESILSWETTIPNGKSWNNPITVAANPGDIVTINPLSGKAFFWVKDGQDKYLIIDGFIIDGGYNAFKFSGNDAGDAQTRHIRVQNTEIKNTESDSILITLCSGCANRTLSPYASYHEFINLNIHHSGDLEHNRHGMYIETGRNVIEQSVIHHNTFYGIHVFSEKVTTAHANIIRNNIIHDNNTGGKSGCGILLSSGNGNIAYNNIIYGNHHGICLKYRATNSHLFNNISYDNDNYGIYNGDPSNKGSRIENNTAYKNHTYGIFIGDGAADSIVRNNISYLNTINNIFLEPEEQTGTIETYNLTTNPLFLNETNNNFHLSAESDAIDRAITINEISIDFDGVERMQGAAPDIGAYEFVKTKDNAPPAQPVDFILVK